MSITINCCEKLTEVNFIVLGYNIVITIKVQI